MPFPVPWSSARWRAVESPCTPAPTTTKCADERAAIHASCRHCSGLVLGSTVARRPGIRSRATVVLVGTLDTKGFGAAAVVRRLHAEGRLDAIGALGGTGGTAIATRAMRALPVGVPKLMVSTVASGDTSPYVGTTDVTMMHSVVDVAGINRISMRIFANAGRAPVGRGAG